MILCKLVRNPLPVLCKHIAEATIRPYLQRKQVTSHSKSFSRHGRTYLGYIEVFGQISHRRVRFEGRFARTLFVTIRWMYLWGFWFSRTDTFEVGEQEVSMNTNCRFSRLVLRHFSENFKRI